MSYSFFDIPQLARERAYAQSVAPPYVPIHERRAYVHALQYPLGTDTVQEAWHLPTMKLRPSNIHNLIEQMESGFRRMSYEHRLSYANAPRRAYVPGNVALASGHRTGLVGKDGDYMPEELDPALGGGYFIPINQANPSTPLPRRTGFAPQWRQQQ